MSSETPRLGLKYLKPSQEQPEVIINDAWNKIDAAVHGGSDVTSDDSSDIGGGSITVEDTTDSPHISIADVTTLRFAGLTVTEPSAGVALITADAQSQVTPGPSLTVEDRADSPATIIEGVAVLRFVGAKLESESGEVALVIIPAPPVGAQWASIPAGAVLSLPTNPVLAVAAAEGHIKEVRIYTKGGSGSCAIDVWKVAAGTLPTSAHDITGANPPTISAGTGYDNTTLTGWNRHVARGDVFMFTLASVSGSFTAIWLSILLG
jgi:hypothetical protein